MRQVSRRFRARIGDVNRWVTEVAWSNDGGLSWEPCTFVAGSTTAASTQQVRWQCELSLTDVAVGRDGINPFSTRLRVRHGMDGEPLLEMGRYKVTSVTRNTTAPELVDVSGQSHELYLINARFVASRTFQSQPASELVETLIREVLPRAQVSWRVNGDLQLPRITEPRDRWPLIDGDRDAASIARSLGARIYTGPAGEWVVAPAPALTDKAVWSARRGDLLLSSSEELTDDGVFNIVVANGQSTDGVPPFAAGIAEDADPLSLTFVGRSPDEGGFGPRPRFYESQLLRSTAQAQTAAQGMLAPALGLRQKVSLTSLHDPTLEPGDVGIVEVADGYRRVLWDSVTYSLTGAPLTGDTRTTATRLAGEVVEADTESGDVTA